MGRDWTGVVSKAGWLGAAVALPVMLTPYYGVPLFIISVLMILAGHTVAAGNAASAKNKSAADPLIGDLRAAASQTVRDLMESEDRHRLVGLLQSGDIIAWCHSEKYKDRSAIAKEQWRLHEMRFVDLPDGPQTTFVHQMEPTAPRKWGKRASTPTQTQYYDIHFNKAQLQRYFPDRRF